jgi:hypothetical protein
VDHAIRQVVIEDRDHRRRVKDALRALAAIPLCLGPAWQALVIGALAVEFLLMLAGEVEDPRLQVLRLWTADY